MSYCLNPDCPKPVNPDNAKFCIRCGTKLLLDDRYRSLKIIGRGRFGITFLAVDEGQPSKPHCIIKQFFPQTQRNDDAEEAAQLFEQKAVRLEEIGTHPQIPNLLAYFTQNDNQYFVQEFIDGSDLDQELEAQGAFSEDHIRQLLNDILPVLQFVHERNVIHRDIKPQNIIRRTTSTSHSAEEGIPAESGEEEGIGGGKRFLVDFGAAKFATEAVLPPTGTVLGTSGYVAPEQALGRGTFASDLYSLGVICIHLLTQVDPFELYSVSEGDWVWRDSLSSPVSEELGQILDKMLEYATKRRYQSAAAVLNDLNRTNTASATPTLSVSPTTPSFQTEPSVTAPAEAAPTPSPQPSPITAPVEPVSTPQTGNWKCVQTLTGHAKTRSDWAGVTSIAFTPDGQWLVSGSEDKTIKVWELSTGTEIRSLTGHADFVNSVAISPDGKWLASVDTYTIKLWDLSTGEEIRTLSGHSALIHSVTFSPDGQMLASGGNDQTIKLWNPNTEVTIRTLSAKSPIDAVSFSPDGQVLASGERNNTIRLWNPNTGEEIRTLTGHSRKVGAVSFSPDGQFLVSGSGDKTIKIWQHEAGELIRTLTGHSGWFAGVHTVVFSPDGQTLASGSDDKTIKLWNPSTGEVITTLIGHAKGVSSLAFSPDGQMLASGSWDKTVKVWQLA